MHVCTFKFEKKPHIDRAAESCNTGSSLVVFTEKADLLYRTFIPRWRFLFFEIASLSQEISPDIAKTYILTMFSVPPYSDIQN